MSQANSVLSANGWFKISVQATGLFKITPGFLSDNGITSNNVSINDLRVVGNGTGMLPEPNSIARPQGLLEVPLRVVDQNNDGSFNGSDYAVFYARGPHQWSNNGGDFDHQLNVYRDANFYFLTVQNGAGARVQPAQAISAVPTVQVNTFDDYDFEEVEEYEPGRHRARVVGTPF
ncbi:MAG: hypothetical protein U5L96_18555 [Owenweeksia sp.]|nr:hypothetical protein [Owenweeksia sp.]